MVGIQVSKNGKHMHLFMYIVQNGANDYATYLLIEILKDTSKHKPLLMYLFKTNVRVYKNRHCF